MAGLSWFILCLHADPVPVRHTQGYLHGFVVLRNVDDKILASGDVRQNPNGNRVTTILTLHFTDGSVYEERSVFSQQRVFRLLSYNRVQRGPSFKTAGTLSFDVSGKVNVESTDEYGKQKVISKQLSLPEDLANGILTTLLTDADPKVETTLSMLVSTPEPRIVKLRISAMGQDMFSVGNAGAKATHYVVKIDIGGVTGAVAKVVGKQPPPTNMWVAVNAPVFLKSEGPLYQDGPIWRIELASPTWPKPTQ
jgi:hypothetical protein